MNELQVFSQEWFDKYQNRILWFANTWIGRRFFRIQRDVPSDKSLVRITPHSVTWMKDSVTYATDFRTHDKFAKRLYYGLKPLWFLLHGWDFVFGDMAKQLDFGFSTLLKYPAVGSTSPVDGYVRRNGVDESFPTIRAGAGTEGNATADDSHTARLIASSTNNQYSELLRSIYCFDTSELGSRSIVRGGVLMISGVDKGNGLGTFSIHIGAATPASTSALAASDYGNVGSVSFASVSYSDLLTLSSTAIDYNQFNLDYNGLQNVSLTGVSKFCGRLSWDIQNDTTGLSWANSDTSYWRSYFADKTGTNKDPRLLVFYYVPSASPTLREEVFFDGTSLSSIEGVTVLANDSYKAARRKPNLYNLFHGQRNKMVNAFYESKTITVKVGINRATRALVENAFDTLASRLHGIEKELVVNQGLSGRRVYIATLVDTIFDKDGGSYMEVDLVFECSDPFGYELTSTLALEIAYLPIQYLVFEGGAPTQAPLITITLTGVTGGTAKNVVIGNGKTNQQVTINRNWSTNDVIKIDSRNKTVRVNDVDVAYTGAIPEWASNELGIFTYSDTLSSRTIVSSSVTYNKRYP